MQIFDVSLTISPNIPVWPGDPPVILERVASIDTGDEVNLTHLSMSVHTGTHVDAPYHFLGGLSATVEKLPLADLCGRAYVLQIEDSIELITRQVLERLAIPSRTRRLLLKTRNSSFWDDDTAGFRKEFTSLTPDGADCLVERGIRLVGIDYLSIASFHAGAPTHRVLLQGGTIILEGLDLRQVNSGLYTLYCLPLKIESSDGAPARVILVRN